MNNVLKQSIGFLFGLGLVWANSVLADHHWKTVEYQTVQVKNNLYAMIAEGGNLVVFIGEEGTFLIDDQFAPLTEKLIAEIKKVGGDIPRFLINTHWHYDHTGGNENLGKAGTLIVAHDNVRKRLSVDNTLAAFNAQIPASPKEALPVITFSTDTSFHLNGETIHARHVHNAHTDGDSVVHFKNANVIHAGDVWFNGFYPFIDVEHGGSLAGMIEATTTIINMSNDNTVIIPGHGFVGDKAALVVYRNMLSDVLVRLRKLKAEGKTTDEAVAAKPTQELDAIWGDGFLKPDQWVRIIYSGLEMPKK
ncbi:MAG TPA: MBL fold metallo-hydrolase [Porticoccus sp.]|nr:MBL fold metallo-hydrolase [Porticoccus sp.]